MDCLKVTLVVVFLYMDGRLLALWHSGAEFILFLSAPQLSGE